MKPRSMFINASRGMVVDDVALREHILSGHIAGAALDVFPVEPKAQGDPFESALRGLDNVILTPHVGGSTQEAQEEIGFFVAGKLATFAADGSTALSVNLPEVAPPAAAGGVPDRLPAPQRAGVLASVNSSSPTTGPTSSGSTSPPAESRATSSPTSPGRSREAALDGLRASDAHDLAAHLDDSAVQVLEESRGSAASMPDPGAELLLLAGHGARHHVDGP